MATAPQDKTRETGAWNLALIGGVLAAIGILLMLIFDGALQTLGIVLAFIAVMPTLVGFGLLLGQVVSKRSAENKPWA